MSHSNKSEISFQLTAVIASCGASFEVDVNPTITGIELKQKIAEDTSISMDDQVLFTQNGIFVKKLSLSLSQSTYKNDIFIFNKNSDCYTISMPPHIYIFDKNHGEHPSIPREYVLNPNNYTFDRESLKKAPKYQLTKEERMMETIDVDILNKYKIEYQHNYKLLKSVGEECFRKMRASKKYVKQIQFQYKSLKVLMKRFNYLKEKLTKQQKKFKSKCTLQIEEHQEYLNEFETDLTNLQSVELHSALQTKTRKTMLDVVDEGSFRNWFEKAVTSQEKQKTLKMERMRAAQSIESKFTEIRQSIEDIKRKKINFGAIKRELESNEKLYQEIHSMIKQYGTKCGKIENTLSILENNDTHGTIMTLMELNNEMKSEAFEEDRNKLLHCAQSFFSMLQHIGSLQEAMANEFTLNVSDITNLNGLISSESRAMDAYKIALDRKDALFFEFVKLKALPSAYKHCIAEIIRRRAFGILMENEINRHLNTIFEMFRNSEISKRKSFIGEYGMLPVDLVSGLTKMPGVIKVAYAAKNEESLPHIEDDTDAMDSIQHELCSEFESIVLKEYGDSNSGSKWKWKYHENNAQHIEEKQNENNIQLMRIKEENKWKREKLQMMKEYEEKLSRLNSERDELESHNKDLEIELDQIKRSSFPDPPSAMDASQSFDGMDSVYIARELSQLLGTSIPNANINRSRLQQSVVFLSKLVPSKSAQNEVLQSDLEKINRELECKENVVQKFKIENEKLKKQNDAFKHKLDKLSESSSALRNEMEVMLNRHRNELEHIEIANEKQNAEVSKLRQNITEYKNEITKLGNGRTDLLQQIKMLSDVSEEWEEKFTSLHNEYMAYKTEKEQKDNLEDINWLQMSHFATKMKKNSIWLSGDFEMNQIAGNNLLFVRDPQAATYRALLDYKEKTNTVLLDEDLITDRLKQLNYPHLLTGEVIYIIDHTWPQNIGQFKKGERVLVATAGSIQPINFNL